MEIVAGIKLDGGVGAEIDQRAEQEEPLLEVRRHDEEERDPPGDERKI